VGVRRQDHRDHRQVIFAGEVEVALIVRGAAEDGPRPVVHQHEIGDPDGQGLARLEGVDDGKAGVVALLLRRLDVGLRDPALAAGGDEGRGLLVMAGDLQGQRMVRRHGQEACAIEGVGPGGVDLDAVLETGRRRARKGEPQAQAL
jgi:hypothetical protein